VAVLLDIAPPAQSEGMAIQLAPEGAQQAPPLPPGNLERRSQDRLPGGAGSAGLNLHGN
jgi:hypothetical protein